MTSSSCSRTRSALDLSMCSGSVTTACWPSHCTGQVSSGSTASGTYTASWKHHDRRSLSGRGHAPDSLVNVSARAVDVLQVEPAPDDAVMLDAEDRHPAHLQPRPVDPGPMPVPLRPVGVPRLRRAQQLGLEIRHPVKHCRPVPAYLLPSGEGPVRVHRLFAAVSRVKAVHEGVQIVPVLGVAQSLEYVSGHGWPSCTHDFLPRTVRVADLR